MSGGIALVDEPELSMHPKWQQKVLQYYRNLFNKDGSQDAQMILATHSEYVLRSALEDRDMEVREAVLIAQRHPDTVKALLAELNRQKDKKGRPYHFALTTWDEEGIALPPDAA